jgi:NADPH2:quinone reductase
MPHAIRVHEHGGPEVLRWEPVEPPPLQPGEVRIRHSAVGLNFIDAYHRTGLYPTPQLPFTPGLEAAGVVTALGPEVTEIAVGERVAYADVPGAYAEERNVPAQRLVALPDDIDEREAAALMLKGMTAAYLLQRTYPVKARETILVHAAAGGVGQLLCRWATSLGATVIGTVGSDAKAEVARACGCRYPIVYSREDVVAAVRDLTNGQGVPVVYDAVGRDTFEASLDCLQPFGLLVSFGQSSGKVPPLDVTTLSAKGSLYLTRPTLMHHIRFREDLLALSETLFDAIRAGTVVAGIQQTYPLADAARAHRELEGRQTIGSSILLP